MQVSTCCPLSIISQQAFQDGSVKYVLSDGRVIWDLSGNFRKNSQNVFDTADGTQYLGKITVKTVKGVL